MINVRNQNGRYFRKKQLLCEYYFILGKVCSSFVHILFLMPQNILVYNYVGKRALRNVKITDYVPSRRLVGIALSGRQEIVVEWPW